MSTQAQPALIQPGQRHRLPVERKAITHKFDVGGERCYITVGIYEDGRPGEIFLKMSKMGTLASGLLDSVALAVSVALQYGVPLSVFVEKFSHMRFEPDGFTGPEFGFAKSIIDYTFRWLGKRFPATGEATHAGN